MSEEITAADINWETVDGGEWASNDDDICRKYAGKWVVALPGRIIACGDDLNTVGAEASRILGVPSSMIVAQSIVHPDEWFKDYPVYTGLPATQSAD